MGIPARFLASKLVNKSLLHVHGCESLPYLQTFLTNDMRHVSPGSGKHCLYSHIINSTGRTLADVFVYQPTISPQNESIERNLVLAPFFSDDFGRGGLETDQVIVECSKSIAGGLQRTLFAMKIRKKVTIEPIPDKQIWAIFPASCSREKVLPTLSQVSDQVFLVSDPRLSELGYRLIVPSSWKIENIQEVIGSNIQVSESKIPEYEENRYHKIPEYEKQRYHKIPEYEKQRYHIDAIQVSESTISEYDKHRYRLGVSEGAKEHPEGHVFPLECNADFLNGISFKKGMFSGDWITGRNYRKGIISRIVPFELESSNSDQLDLVAPDSTLIDPSTNRTVGEIRARRGKIGLASISNRFLRLNGGISSRNGEISSKNGEISSKNGEISSRNGEISSRNGEICFTHYSSHIKGRCWIPKWWPEFVQRVNETNIPDGRRRSSIIPESQR